MTTLPVDAPAVVSLTHLDEDWAVPCERFPKPWPKACEQQAEWVAWTIPCCPKRSPVILLCAGHKDDLIASESGICVHCGNEFVPCRAGFRLIEPLNRRTTWASN